MCGGRSWTRRHFTPCREGGPKAAPGSRRKRPGGLGGLARAVCKPAGIRRIADEPAVVIRRAVVPPNIAALPQGTLGGIHTQSRGDSCPGIRSHQNRSPGAHKLAHEPFVLRRVEGWIAQSPQPPPDHHMAAVGRVAVIARSYNAHASMITWRARSRAS